jgi:hypothetical protein
LTKGEELRKYGNKFLIILTFAGKMKLKKNGRKEKILMHSE